jgi:hypothetical protein
MKSAAAAVFHDVVLQFLQRNVDDHSGDNIDLELIRLFPVGSVDDVGNDVERHLDPVAPATL